VGAAQPVYDMGAGAITDGDLALPVYVVPGGGELNPTVYLTTYYVRTNGNDGTGTGSSAAPWLTLSKAMTVAGAGDLVLVGDGTYAENTSASGAWTIAKSVASNLTIQSESRDATKVIITGSSGASNTIFNTGASAFLVFKNLTFGMLAASSYALRFNANCTNLTFRNCIIDANGSAAALGGISHVSAAAVVASSVAFINCTTTTSGSGGYNGGVFFAPTAAGTAAPTFVGCTLAGGMVLQNAGAGGTFNNCIISGAGRGVRTIAAGTIAITGGSITGGTNCGIDANGAAITVTNCLITNNSATHAAMFGVDGTAGNATTGSITNCTILRSTSLAGHALLIGAGCSNFLADTITAIQAYDYAVVVKECAGAIVRNCGLTGGSTVAANAALYFKAATGASATNNTLVTGANFGVRVLKGDTNNKCGTITLTTNTITTTGTAVALDWGDSTNDSGGGVCDFNSYNVHSSLIIGNVRLTAGITTLAGLQAAWSGYDVSGNDTHSTVTL